MQNIFSNKKHCFANKFNIITNSSAVNISICFILTVFLFLGIAIYCNTRISGLCLNNESTNTITDNYKFDIFISIMIISFFLIYSLQTLIILSISTIQALISSTDVLKHFIRLLMILQLQLTIHILLQPDMVL